MNIQKLGEICRIGIGRTPSRNERNYWGKGHSWLSIADMKDEKSIYETKEEITDLAIQDCKMVLVPKGTLVFSFKLSVGKIGITARDLYTNEAIASLKIIDKKNVYQPFLYYSLKTFNFDGVGDRAVKGITLNKAKLSNLQIPLPPLAEQKRIADLLDKADALRKKNKELLAAYDELLKATFLDMFGDPVSNPKEWKRIKLGDFGNWRSGGTPSRTVKEYYDGNIPWLSSGELESLFVSESNEKITEKAISESAAKKIEIGSLLLGMYDTAALKSSINTSIVTCNQAIAFARLDDTKINTLFAYTQIQLGKEFFRSKQRGVRQKNLNLSMIKSIELIYPPLSLQNKFACIVKNIEAQKVLVKQSLQESEDLFNGLVQKAFKD